MSLQLSNFRPERNKFVWFFIAIYFLSFNLVAFSKQTTTNVDSTPPLKVGFVLIGSSNDGGWNQAHNQGRLFLQSTLKDKVITEFAENVPDSAECQRVIEKMIARGNRLIFTTSYGFLEHAEKEAARHPEVIFVHLARPSQSTLKNLGTCLTYHWEPMYIAGLVAGKMTKTNKLGIIAAHPVPQVLQTINSFTLGAHSINPKVSVRVIWTNTWHDPATEAEAARSLIEDKFDVITMHENSPATILRTAEKNKIFCVGFHSNLENIAPNYWLTGECWNWGPLYTNIVQAVLAKKWKPGNQRFGMNSGYVSLAPFGKCVPLTVQHEALKAMHNIVKGQLIVFAGPLSDRNGKQIMLTNKPLSSGQIDSMNWLVPGIEGSLPVN